MYKGLKQTKFQTKEFKSQLFFGGSLTTKRAHRTARPLSTRYPIHLVLRSSKAVGKNSFWEKKNKFLIKQALNKFSLRWGIKIINCANVGNHLHLYMQLSNRFTYEKFIRSLTGTLALQITRHNKNLGEGAKNFWDYRPYTRIVIGEKAHLVMKDYLLINQMEGLGASRFQAKIYLLREHEKC
ncbi:MAG: transposase [Oligoflexia bacterium]|nr:transposase [Oligoflexia bacterium]